MRPSHSGLALLAVVFAVTPAGAVTSTESVPSTFGGNGHNISFDGRVLLVRDHLGWGLYLLRPEAITYRPDGLPDATGTMWSPRMAVLDGDIVENAVAICEADPSRAPYRCDAAGTQTASGPHDCYDLWLIDSDAATPAGEGGATLRRRQMTVWVANPRSPAAVVLKADLSGTENLSPTLRGIEPTITADGKLMVWQGHPANDGQIDILMYAVTSTACGASGWSTPRVISEMAEDDLVVGKYRLAERTLRAADGAQFNDGDLVRGAYPWLMPSGDAVVFQAAPMPCRAENDPPGCGPRRNSFAVLGYPTNWGVAIVDGGANPAADDIVRLFFSSPGPTTLAGLPVTSGLDVWPFFGSNTSNYVELIFDDGLDGNYAGFWHFNENVNKAGDLDLTRVPDVSGYFNTGTLLGGLEVARRNNGVLGRALTFDGIDDRVSVPHSITLNPINGITIDFWIRPTAEPDCDADNNYRLLLGKGDIGTGTYSVVLEEGRALQVRFQINGEQQSIVTPGLALDAWTHVSCEWDGPTGQAACYYDDVEVATAAMPSGTLSASSEPLTIGAPGPRPACPSGDGAFAGMLDELSISRYARRLGEAPADGDAGPGSGADGGPPGQGQDGGGPGGSGGGCGCRASSTAGGAGGLALLLIALAAVRTAGCRRRRLRRGG